MITAALPVLTSTQQGSFPLSASASLKNEALPFPMAAGAPGTTSAFQATEQRKRREAYPSLFQKETSEHPTPLLVPSHHPELSYTTVPAARKAGE